MKDDSKDLRFCLQLASVALLLTLPAVLLPTWVSTDSSTLYTPMIREFAAGNWSHAFYPMGPPAFLVFGGILAATGISALTAAKLASALFYAATVFPVFYLNRLVWGRRTAVVTVWLFILCSRLLRYAGLGLLDTGKTFFLVLTVYGVFNFARDPRWRATWVVAAGAIGLALIRGEGVVFSLIALVALVIVALRCARPSDRRKALWRTAAAILLFAAGIAPWLAYEYRTTGFPVTDQRQIRFVRPLMNGGTAAMPVDPAISLAGGDLGKRIDGERQPTPLQRFWDRMVIELFKGFFPPYLVLIVPVLVWRWRRRLDEPRHRLLLGCAVLHTVVLIGVLGGMSVQKRYVIAALPLVLGWAATGWIALTAAIRNHRAGNRRLVIALTAVVVVILVWDGTKKIRPESKERKQEWRQVVVGAAAWLRSEGRELLPANLPPIESTLLCYHNGRRPVVLTNFSQLTLLAEADLVQPSSYRYQRTFSVAELLDLCFLKQVDYVVADRHLRQQVPDLEQAESLGRVLVPCYIATVAHSSNELVIYRFNPDPPLADEMQL